MATIMADHIQNKSPTCSQSQCAVIIQAAAPDIRPYMSTAIATTHDQQSTTTSSHALPTNHRSRVTGDLTGASRMEATAFFTRLCPVLIVSPPPSIRWRLRPPFG